MEPETIRAFLAALQDEDVHYVLVGGMAMDVLGTSIDIVARLGETFSYDDLEAAVHAYGDVRVKVATPRTLYRMKRDTVRLRDKADAEALKEKFRLKD